MSAPLQSGPTWGIVLGSGLGGLVDQLEIESVVPYADVPGLPVSTVAGHAGRFVFGCLGGIGVAVAQGRTHLYEGRSAQEVTAGIRYLAGLGIRRLIVTNAAGTLNCAHAPGSWMMIADHLNLTGTSPLLGSGNFIDMSAAYSSELRAHFRAVATQRGLTLHEGIYAGLLGPQYETPAEIRMLGRLGADAVGMSTVLETIQARALGMEVAGFSCLTNWAAGINAEPLSHAEVMKTGNEAAAGLVDLLSAALPCL